MLKTLRELIHKLSQEAPDYDQIYREFEDLDFDLFKNEIYIDWKNFEKAIDESIYLWFREHGITEIPEKDLKHLREDLMHSFLQEIGYKKA